MSTPEARRKPDTRCAELIHVLTTDDEKLPRLVEVLWMDALGTGMEWETPEETDAYRVEPTMSVGYVWSETEEHIHLISTLNTMHTCHGIMIPTGCIEWVRDLR